MLVGHLQRNGLALLFEFNDNLRYPNSTKKHCVFVGFWVFFLTTFVSN